ncbi:MAG: hypothetical protein IKU83_07110 [Lachnospiraceae bacterium]|nr:hypothetical protein [Lachnospiraceae bacterium]
MKEEKVRYAGMDLLMFGSVGAEGTMAITKEGRSVLEKTLPEDFLDEICEWHTEAKPECAWEELGATRVWPVGEGGLFAALWQMALDTGAGFRIDLKQLPMRQETIEVCEVFDLNPYQLASAGSYLVVVENGNEALWLCRKKGIKATLIGKLSADHDKAIYNEDNIRFLDRPKPDELLRFRELMKGEE